MGLNFILNVCLFINIHIIYGFCQSQELLITYFFISICIDSQKTNLFTFAAAHRARVNFYKTKVTFTTVYEMVGFR